jgi:CRP-like cAMP-binding protein
MALLEERDRLGLSVVGRVRRFRPGASIMRQGDHSQSVFLVLEGRVRITLDTSDGRLIVLAVYGPGDLVGEFEALGGRASRTASVVAVDPVTGRVLSQQAFRRYLLTHPQASLALVRLMIGRLATADRRRTDSTTQQASLRLARFLLEVVGDHGASVKAGVDVDVPLAQHELASLIGVSRNSIVRALSTLRSHGLLTTTRRTIRIPDPAALRRYVDSEHSDAAPS